MHDIPSAGEFAALCRAQEGTVRLADAARLLTRSAVRAQLDAKRWQQPHSRVVVTHNGPLTPVQRLWIALLAGPHSAVLGGSTAARLDGMTGITDQVTHVVIPQGASRPEVCGVHYRFSTQLGPEDVHPNRHPPRTRIARSLVDAAISCQGEKEARWFIISGAQQRLVKPAAMRDALSRRARCRWRRIIEESIDDAEGGIHSLPERDFDRIVVARGLPAPTRQAVMQRPGGAYYLDAHWKKYCTSAEIHGSQHLEPAQWDTDLERGSEIAAQGGRLLQFSSYAVRHQPDRVGDQLARALTNAGWRGER
jgi:hypothetical protein